MNMHQLDRAHRRYTDTRAIGFDHREALTWTLTSAAAAREMNEAITTACDLYGTTVIFEEDDMDRLLSLARQHPESTPQQLGSLLVQDVYLSRVDEVRQADTSLSYGDALKLAAEKFPNEFAMYERATGQSRRRR